MMLMTHRRAPRSLVWTLGLASVACTPTGSDDAARSKATPSDAARAPEAPVGPPADAVALAPGSNFVCALQRAGTVACWGYNSYGQLGQSHRDFVVEVEDPVHLKGLTDAVSIAASHSTACAVRRNGTVVCWGSGAQGKLGNGQAEELPGLVEVTVVHDATAVFGGRQLCATTPSGVWCWGSWAHVVQFIDPNRPYGPWLLPFDNVRELHSSYQRTFALHEDGSVVAWVSADHATRLDDVVEVNADGLECFVRTSGQVDCTTIRDEQRVLERLHGAKQLALANLPDLVVGLLPDGSLAAERLDGGQPPSFSPPRDIVELAPLDHLGKFVGIHRSGQVFEWRPEQQGNHYVAREVVLPDPSAEAPTRVAEQPPHDLNDDDADDPLPPSNAAERCNQGWSSFLAGDLAAAKLDVDAALTVLERVTDERGQRSLGACLYNRGRIAEQEGDLGHARELYRRSLAARPNDTVQARLDSLGSE
jgi:hypothetical protein